MNDRHEGVPDHSRLAGGTVARVVDWKRGLRRVLYPAYEARVVRRLPERADSQARRGDARRQPALGQGRRGGHRPGPPRRRRQHRAAARLVRGDRRRGGHAVAALHRQPEPPGRRSSSRCSTIIGEAVETLAEQQRWRLHPVGALDLLPAAMAERLKQAAESTRDVDGLLVNIAVGYGGRREIADAVRSLLHEHAGKGTTIEELAECHRRRAHRRAPLHQGPARPRPGDPHQRRAAPRRLPALAERPERVLLLRGLLARLPARRLPACRAGLCRAGAKVRDARRARSASDAAERSRGQRSAWRPTVRATVAAIVSPTFTLRSGVSAGTRSKRITFQVVDLHQQGDTREGTEWFTTTAHTWRSALGPPAPVPVRAHQLDGPGAECACRSQGEPVATAKRVVRTRSPTARRRHPRSSDLRPRHLGPAGRPGGVETVRGARGGAAGGGDHRARGQAAPPGARLLRPLGAADARRAAGRRTAASTSRSRWASTAAPIRVELNHTDAESLPSGFRLGDNDTRILAVARNLANEGHDVIADLQGPAAADQGLGRRASTPPSTAASRSTSPTPAGPG